jgi:hypothetical protein
MPANTTSVDSQERFRLLSQVPGLLAGNVNQLAQMKSCRSLFIETGHCYDAIWLLHDLAFLNGTVGSLNQAIRRDHHSIVGMVDQCDYGSRLNPQGKSEQAT